MSVVSIPLGSSIQAAVDANPAGTVFQLADGTYRGETFQAKSGDQFIGAPDGGTVLSGAIVLNNWTNSGGYWVESGLPTPLTGQVISGSNPLSSDLNDLFVNNVLYTRVASLSQVTAGTWYFNPTTNSAYISANPTGQTVEYSVTPNLTSDASGATGVVMQNLTIEKYATDAQSGPIQGVVDWNLDNVTSTQNHGAGVNIGAGTIIQGGNYSDNGQIGIEGTDATGAQVLNAVIADNNYAGYNTAWDAGGLKMSTSANVVISGDDVYGNNGQGIWGDIDSSNWTVSNNTVTNNAGNGIMYEISHATTSITDNTISNNGGSGIYISNSDGVSVTGNTITVSASNVPGSNGAAGGGGIDIINDVRGSGPLGVYQSINDDVEKNVIIQPGGTAQSGIFVYQAYTTSNPNDVFNDNTYYVANSTGSLWHFGSTNYTWSALQQSATYEAGGTQIVGMPATSSPAPSSTPGAAPPAPSPTPTPAPTPTPTPPTPAPTPPVITTGPTTGTGPDTLVLSMSEDAYLGDATFTVSIDGQQLGGTFTVTASHAAGDSETFTFAGNWAEGSHAVSVDFTNDAYGGSSTLDRNLYVNDVTYDGTNTGQSAALYTDGAQTFTVQDTTPIVVTVPPTETTVTVSVNSAIINASTGSHLIFISGDDDTFNLSGGTEKITDSGKGGNTFNLPAAGGGSVIFNAAVMTDNDVFNLKPALANTLWNGSASTIGSYLHVRQVAGSTELLVSKNAASTSTGTLLATFVGDKTTLSGILAHAIQ